MPRAPRLTCWRLCWLACALLLATWPVVAHAHDASGWGGLFRSRDGGATWFSANQGRLVGAALAIAVDPRDADHLLLGTDDGVLVSRNGGRDWEIGASSPRGPVSAVALDQRGQALAATGLAVFRAQAGGVWEAVVVPTGFTPVRSFIRGSVPGQVYALNKRGVQRSEDSGQTWAAFGSGLPDGDVTSLLVLPETVLCVVDGRVWAAEPASGIWQDRSDGLPSGPVQGLSVDARGTVWAAVGEQVFTWDGPAWRSVGTRLPESGTEIRGIAGGARLIVSTHRGVYASTDDGVTWNAAADNVPGHLEAGPLVSDPTDPAPAARRFWRCWA